MEIRSITLFVEPDLDPAAAAAFFGEARPAFARPVQTTRVATTPFPGWWPVDEEPAAQAIRLSQQWREAGADYVCLGPVQLDHDAGWLERLPEIVAASDNLFASVEIAGTAGRLDVGRCWAAADLIRRLSTLQANGFGNLYLAALANCPPGSPFFPVAYHSGGPARFALAVEAADLAVSAFEAAGSLEEARGNLVTAIEQEAAGLVAAAEALAEAHRVAFGGLDFSLAPFPTPERSLAGAMEALGLPWVGAPGSLFAAAFITEAIGRARFPRCGFSGLMLPVLEDSVLALRASQGRLALSDLLSYSAVCGVGLDTIPLPGDVSQATLAGILLDVAALAVRLDKPLTARLMPLPGLAAGDPVHFDFPYFADSRVMPAPGPGVSGLLQDPARLEFNNR
ncbi:MAG: DUF711 family protein [Chloroflexi bacterium]|nr:DUF711 family protein [Chloroflexota bacterium]MCI0576659.1 DUF711 family protein [Chloroflexota bacterium]MCI0647972.1 DUF711 family protein [Chloroflexota bacterium]MCI0726818.1 DUF711 family protein [Chloroflexota bacterium]